MTVQLGLLAKQGTSGGGTARQTQAEHERRTLSVGGATWWFEGAATSGAGISDSWPAAISATEIKRDTNLGSFVFPPRPGRVQSGTRQDLGGWPLPRVTDNSLNAGAEKRLDEQTTLRRQMFGNDGQTVRASAIAVVRDLLQKEQITAARRLLHLLSADVLDDPAMERLRRALAAPVVRASEHRDVERRDEYGWLRHHAGEYRGQWVALAGNRLVAHAPTLRELRARLSAETIDRPPLLHRL